MLAFLQGWTFSRTWNPLHSDWQTGHLMELFHTSTRLQFVDEHIRNRAQGWRVESYYPSTLLCTLLKQLKTCFLGPTLCHSFLDKGSPLSNKSIVFIYAYKNWNNIFRILRLMRTNHEASRTDRHTFEIRLVESLIEAYQLRYESHVGVSDWSTFLHKG